MMTTTGGAFDGLSKVGQHHRAHGHNARQRLHGRTPSRNAWFNAEHLPPV
jgi:hypothetical protein